MKTILGVKGLALTEYAISANAILGIRDSGKTYTATKAAEELIDAGVPWIALDPIGVWHALRQPGKGKGYPVVVAGGRHADIPLKVGDATALVREAMATNVSLVLDLFSIEMTKADWRVIVRNTVNTLLHENADHGLRHVFIEEAAEFVPQKVQDGQVFAAVEKLVRMGGNSKVGVTLINQRSADLNKSVLELCANVFVHRQTGKNTLMDLAKWFDMMGLSKEERAEIGASLPNLKSGQCWVFSTDIKEPVLIKVPAKNSKHPDRREVTTKKVALADRTGTPAAFIERMKINLGPPKPKAPPVSPAKPTAAAMAAGHNKSVGDADARGYQRGVKAGYPAGFKAGYDLALEQIWAKVCHLANHIGDQYRREQLLFKMPKPVIPPELLGSAAPQPIPHPADRPQVARTFDAPAGGGMRAAGNLGKAGASFLGVLAHFPGVGVSKAKLGLMAGYSAKSGSFRNTLSELRTAGLINTGEPVMLTEAGAEVAPVVSFPHGQQLLAYWQGHSALGKAEREMLGALVAALPGGLSKEDLGATTGYSAASGSFRNALSVLRVLGLIKGKGGDDLQAAPEFAS